MLSDHAQDWNNYWKGRSAQTSGDALLGVGIEDNDILTDFWQNIFSNMPKSTQLIDFACGAGSVLKQAKMAGLSNLTGIDVSKNAIDVLKTKIPSAIGYVGPVTKTPFQANSFDMVVSQFGFEYAGGASEIIEAVKEMDRILRPKGAVVLVTHIEGGAIESGCQQSLEQITHVLKSGFLDNAKKCLIAVNKAHENSTEHHKQALDQSMSALNVSAEPLMTWLKGHNNPNNEFARFTYYLLESSHKLISQSQKYHLNDSLLWLENMRSEILAYEGRMASMIRAAMNEDIIAQVFDIFRQKKRNIRAAEKLYFKIGHAPAAWILRAGS